MWKEDTEVSDETIFVEFRRKVRSAEMLSAAMHRLLEALGFTGRLTVVVQNGSVSSNPVTVPVAPTAPGIFTPNSSGSGPGAILHADYSLVNAAKPAISGETVLIFLTGMGGVSPTVADGTAGGSNPLSKTTVSQIDVRIGGQPGTVIYSGLAPGFPGLYQMNVTLPPVFPFTGNVPVAIVTPNAAHDQVDIVIQ